MAVGEAFWPLMHEISGVRLGVASAGIKYPDRKDVAVLLLAETATVAGVFTQNGFCAAPVKVCKQHLGTTANSRALIINSGNANACTGELGHAAALRTCSALASKIAVETTQVLPFSTGVIGEPLPENKIIAVLDDAIHSASEDHWALFARAIMTTDTRPKGASKVAEWKGQKIHVTGVAKGAGMIKPNMATMLAYVATDAAVSPEALQEISLAAANASFNRISIDGDTSTNDSCMLIASGMSQAEKINDSTDEGYALLLEACIEVYQSLAKQIVMDGEGATKCVKISVRGGKHVQECLDVGYAIAHSPLIKTAMFACDPNWGRIVAAIGYAGIDGLNADRVKVWLDDVLIVADGGRAPNYQEENGQAIFDKAEFSINIDLQRGEYSEHLWTSDLSHEYVRINAEYRS
ncbi:Arginine biosynthesis bifunctional protein ArgJ [Thalassocella blandensis]|nr:Arginine biosynthesis bifunctional protein ArgJ [Thalassocella blandensis]